MGPPLDKESKVIAARIMGQFHTHYGLVEFVAYLLLLGTREMFFNHLASFPSSREMLSRLGIEPPTSPLSLGTIPLIIRKFRANSNQLIAYLEYGTYNSANVVCLGQKG
jgi:hypothetical protein